MKKIKEIIKEYYKYLLIIILTLIIFNIKLPYYILAPGGIIQIDDRITSIYKNETKGSINLLYVTEYEATPVTYLLSYILKDWDIEKIEDKETITTNKTYLQNRIMLDNSVSNAIYVAYQKSGKQIKIKEKHNIVLDSYLDNSIKFNDEIIKVNDIEVDNINDIKEILANTTNDKLKLSIKRNNDYLDIDVPITYEDNKKIIGIIAITNYEYDIEDEIEIKFSKSEGGPSGGLMIALSIYNAINEIDITKGLKIGGTGTIDINGNVGEIDGIKYKIQGAVKNNLDIVFVPEENYEEAIKVKEENNYNIKIYKVSTFDEVIEYLKNL